MVVFTKYDDLVDKFIARLPDEQADTLSDQELFRLVEPKVDEEYQQVCVQELERLILAKGGSIPNHVRTSRKSHIQLSHIPVALAHFFMIDQIDFQYTLTELMAESVSQIKQSFSQTLNSSPQDAQTTTIMLGMSQRIDPELKVEQSIEYGYSFDRVHNAHCSFLRVGRKSCCAPLHPELY